MLKIFKWSFWTRPATSTDELRKVIEWFACGQTGLSSRALAGHLAGVGVAKGYLNYPHDGGDLGRCIQMLRFVGWEHRIGEMRGVSNEWTALAKHWDELTELYDTKIAEEGEFGYFGPPRRPRRNASAKAVAQFEADLAAYEARPGMKLYNRMKAILGPAEAKTRTTQERRRARKEGLVTRILRKPRATKQRVAR